MRQWRTRVGERFNAEQEVADGIGPFARAGVAGETTEQFDFTDIDRTAAAGGSIAGGRWRRSGDTVGIASSATASAARTNAIWRPADSVC